MKIELNHFNYKGRYYDHRVFDWPGKELGNVTAKEIADYVVKILDEERTSKVIRFRRLE